METTLDPHTETITTEILVFKTNVRFKKDVRMIAKALDKQVGIYHWNIDTEDKDRVLRIKAASLSPLSIIQLIETAGYYCQELPD